MIKEFGLKRKNLDKMKALILAGLFLALAPAAHAQQYLLKEFTACSAKMKNGQPVRGLFNYNCNTQRMEFMDGETVMELTNSEAIDTLYLGPHKMIPYSTKFLEVVFRCKEFSLAVDYKAKAVNLGREGAMGTRSQMSVASMDLKSLGIHQNHPELHELSVWKHENENGYYLVQKNKMKRFNNTKTLLKLIPERKDKVEAYLASHKVDYHDTDQVLEMLISCMQ